MRISLFAGTGASKSTNAAWLFSKLKICDISIELTTEYVKKWAYQKRAVNEFDQVYLFGKQIQAEYLCLSNGVKNIVTDSPILLSSIYANYYYKDINVAKSLEQISDEFEKKFPSFNIFLERKDRKYNQNGRYQDYGEALMIDNLIKEKLKNKYNEQNLAFCDYNDRERLLKLVLDRIDK